MNTNLQTLVQDLLDERNPKRIRQLQEEIKLILRDELEAKGKCTLEHEGKKSWAKKLSQRYFIWNNSGSLLSMKENTPEIALAAVVLDMAFALNY